MKIDKIIMAVNWKYFCLNSPFSTKLISLQLKYLNEIKKKKGPRMSMLNPDGRLYRIVKTIITPLRKPKGHFPRESAGIWWRPD